MRVYQKRELEMLELEEDIVRTSGGMSGGGNGGGGLDEGPNIYDDVIDDMGN